MSIDSAVSVNERYRPLLDYLEAEIGRLFELVSLFQETQFTEVAAGKLDFTTNNPLAAVQIRRLYGVCQFGLGLASARDEFYRCPAK